MACTRSNRSADLSCVESTPNDFEFANADGTPATHFFTQFMGQFPVDDFVLNRNQRIMFDINVNVNRTCPDAGAWEIELPPGQYLITFVYDVHRELVRFR